MQIVILSIWLGLMFAAVGLAIWVIQNSKPKRASRTSARKKNRPVHLAIKTNSRQWKELLSLLHGDTDAANRLVNAEMRRNPTRTAQWCIDKALWQLKRDR
ncbi:MAG: hypothetical protein NWQ28_03810, partial [Nodularia sp. (in: cyanobacteria)]|nr:hypothetical protein [Nodularia sp. (in: cyanobacteria)]